MVPDASDSKEGLIGILILFNSEIVIVSLIFIHTGTLCGATLSVILRRLTTQSKALALDWRVWDWNCLRRAKVKAV
jgi:hypothetical protein